MRAFKKLKDLPAPLWVEFVGKTRSDSGGLTRDMFSNYFESVENKIVHLGKDGEMSLMQNVFALEKEEYRAFGIGVGLTIIHGSGIPRPFF